MFTLLDRTPETVTNWELGPTEHIPPNVIKRFLERAARLSEEYDFLDRLTVEDFDLPAAQFIAKLDRSTAYRDPFWNICREQVVRPPLQKMLERRYGGRAYYMYLPKHVEAEPTPEFVMRSVLWVGAVDETGVECFLFTADHFYRGGAYRPDRYNLLHLMFARRISDRHNPNYVSFSGRYFILRDMESKSERDIPVRRLNGVGLLTLDPEHLPRACPIILESAPLEAYAAQLQTCSALFRDREYAKIDEVRAKLAEDRHTGTIRIDKDEAAATAAANLARFPSSGAQAFPADTADAWPTSPRR
ncbi:MAG: hypothetical protein ABL308_14525 [Oceanicaulis sp.]